MTLYVDENRSAGHESGRSATPAGYGRSPGWEPTRGIREILTEILALNAEPCSDGRVES